MAGTASLAARSDQRVRFDHKDMDYYFSWILGRRAFGASDEGECFDAAERIPNGDTAAWHAAWRDLAGRVESAARSVLEQGDQAGARSAFLRACTYYRAPLFMMDPKEPAFSALWQKMQACFREANALAEQPAETTYVPYGDRQLPGYFWPVAPNSSWDDEQKHPTLIIIGGIETFAEDCYLMAGPAALAQGYNVLTVDLPGQGMTPRDGLHLEARSDRAVRAVVDYALTRREVDPEHLALFGFSWGGHIALMGAQGEPRIKALIANPATHNIFTSALAQQGKGGLGDPILRLVMEQLAWRWGVRLTDIPGRLARASSFLIYARADPRKIVCPVLCMAGESEAKVTLDQTRKTFELLPHPRKKLAILTREQGGAAHCQVDNLDLLNRTIFEWLGGLRLPA